MLPAQTHNEQDVTTPAGRFGEQTDARSLALHRLLFDAVLSLGYQLLQQLQSGLPLLRRLLAKNLVGHAFEGERPHDLPKEQ